MRTGYLFCRFIAFTYQAYSQMRDPDNRFVYNYCADNLIRNYIQPCCVLKKT